VLFTGPATYVTNLASCFVNSVLQMTRFSPSADSNILEPSAFLEVPEKRLLNGCVCVCVYCAQFQQIMDALFVSFDASISVTSFNELSGSVFSWLEEYCKPQVSQQLPSHVALTCQQCCRESATFKKSTSNWLKSCEGGSSNCVNTCNSCSSVSPCSAETLFGRVGKINYLLIT